eukprot:CAMPEP_0177296274 /NCGR_PEP_ID=MMETSP0368-20130122/2336_1 /TAXON_ID=447022 ORGANISM="Scrippsiella hangoei-like, Strain SHHI-4" /NCGR_SAMPLE_ID=MMETSP0368 /ASSEMBLY_ACC=CAM_ASM_000363 /LENGTH=213 /DNA_ID=CAMNT_0018754391 /DNA_START=43 /DNA_END=680 /DNA_ORIENTATION=-
MLWALRGCCRSSWRACGIFWGCCCDERIISPLLVLLLHGAILGDVVWHRPNLQRLEDAWAGGLWVIALATLVLYLQAASTDPGWLRPKSMAFASPLGCLLCPLTLLCSVAMCRGYTASLSSALPSHHDGGTANSQGDAAELQSLVGSATDDCEVGSGRLPLPLGGSCGGGVTELTEQPDVEGVQKRRGGAIAAGTGSSGEETPVILGASSLPL